MKGIRIGLRVCLWGYAVVPWVFSREISPVYLAVLLAAAALDAAHLRFFKQTWALTGKSFLFAAVSFLHVWFIPLPAIAALDAAAAGTSAWIALPIAVIAAGIFHQNVSFSLSAALICTAAALAGHVMARYSTLQEAFRETSSAENRLKLELEQSISRLESTSRNLVRETERNERSRIAQSIHDEVGHRLTGILMQLQASERLMHREPERSEMMLRRSIEALGEAVEVLRDTIHDLRPRPRSDAAALRDLVSSFRLKGVELFMDDQAFGSLDALSRDGVIESVREMLTNAARHAHAETISLRVTCEDQLVLEYLDDGSGASHIREGLGLRGIRSLFTRLGGSVSVSGTEGFRIICRAPLKSRGEGGDDEAVSGDDL